MKVGQFVDLEFDGQKMSILQLIYLMIKEEKEQMKFFKL
jgi:hypothetical protein